jgi:predicted metal-dependent peptidase
MQGDLISFEEKIEIGQTLSEHHSIFQTFWSIGQIIFTDKIPTAAVGFDSLGDVIYMIINPSFWNELDIQNKAFVISHECLHVILNHGKRGQNYKDHKLVNIAQDIVINEMLVNGFGFNKLQIKDWDKFCFVDTLFDKETISDKNIHTKGSFKYYYDLLNDNEHNEEQETVDQHSNSEGLDSDIQDLIDQMKEHSQDACEYLKEEIDPTLSDKEKVKFAEEINSEFQESQYSAAGDIPMGADININLHKVKKNKKWESIVKNHIRSISKTIFVEKPSWITRDRRSFCLDEDLFAQGDWEVQVSEKQKYKLVFFLDSSGSCYSYAERFVGMLRTIPEDIFEIQAFSFDRSLYPIDIKEGKIRGGGGTSFRLLNNYIDDMTKETKHPDAVFVLSDGDGDNFMPQKPKLWHWLLTPYHRTHLIPKESIKHNMNDFQ